MSNFISNTVTDLMLSRRSVRDFTDESVTADELHTILECGIWAPSGRNSQSTLLVPCSDTALLEELNGAARELMSGGSYPIPPDTRFAYGAPAFVFVYAEDGDAWADLNAGLVLENMTLAAESLRLATVMIGMVKSVLLSADANEWKNRLGVPESYSFACGLAIGHAAKAPTRIPERREGLIIYKQPI